MSTRLFPPALWNVGWRYLLAHRWQTVLMVLGIAVGVAVVVAIDLANAAAGRAFQLSTETVTGRTTHQIEGGPFGVEDSLYADLRREAVVEVAAPVISETILSPDLGGQPLTLLGIDPFADAPFRSFLEGPGAGRANPSASRSGWTVEGPGRASGIPGQEVLAAFLVRPGAVLMSQQLAERYGLSPGDTLRVFVGGYERQAVLTGLLIPADDVSRRTLDGLILADIATAQELTGRPGWLSRIDLILPEGDSTALSHLENWLPQGYRVVEAAARSSAIQQMSAAFQLNLTALSLLALVVGLFLIYNTMTFSVVQRRGLFGTLRCLGVTRREVFALVISEATLVGLLGGGLGILLGLAMGRFTVAMVLQTVNDLYFTTTVREVGIDSGSLIKGALTGLLATVATAALPAWEAASVPPRAALLRSGLESKARRSVGGAALLGLLAGAAGLGLFFLPTTSLAAGFGGTLFVVVGFALLSAGGLVLMMRLVGPLVGRIFGLVGRMAPRNLTNTLSRTAVAVAALMVAVAVTIGVDFMIDSFRGTLVSWLEGTLQGDVYVSVPDLNATRASAPLDPRAVEIISAEPGVERIDMLRTLPVDTTVGPVALYATENPRLGFERRFSSLSVPQEEVWDALERGGVLLSEPFANRLDVHTAGGTVDLNTPNGSEAFPVIGIYYDYTSSEGIILMSLDTYRARWNDPTLTALALRLEPGFDADAVTQSLQERLSGVQLLLIRPNAALRQDALEVFDRTFAITVALRVLATVVAFIGVLNSLLLLQLEKAREVGILRALGLTGQELWRLVMLETGLMGLAAGILAIPTGFALSLILIFVINRRSFGWTLQLEARPETIVQALLVALAAALLAGLYPAWKMRSAPAAEVIRYE